MIGRDGRLREGPWTSQPMASLRSVDLATKPQVTRGSSAQEFWMKRAKHLEGFRYKIGESDSEPAFMFALDLNDQAHIA